ncbi:VanZ family protein [Ramlibacter sp. PS4R-6]|uniref:VanZ family protein n=1 Tax=Ramlibacter sp. PS4R-6 TaxID=3133438 RepID=UPI00309A6B67
MNVFQRLPRRLLLAAFWLALVVIAVLALLPATMPLPSTGWDKANHTLAFAVLALLGSACWPSMNGRVLVALAAYGGAIEIAQTFTETRMGEWIDWLADVAGLAVAAAYLAWKHRRRRRRAAP